MRGGVYRIYRVPAGLRGHQKREREVKKLLQLIKEEKPSLFSCNITNFEYQIRWKK